MSVRVICKQIFRHSRMAGVGAMAGALLLSGCVGSFTGGNTDSKYINRSASETEIASAAPSALPIIASECPEIKIRPGGESFALYARGKEGDPKGLRYQAVIDKQSRNCIVSNGLITVKMGVVGRLLAGPEAGSGAVDVPLRFAVERDDMAVFSEKYNIPITITPPNQGEEFVKVVENVAIPYVGGEQITIWVGFDPKG
ncbi:hypothetical protein [Maritalea mediterranea]|uniref:Lipoprotein n=1 Tax=Maritalea mediterranea TaxID=2909667 RepID=A0ABS9E6E4_9HYPH|nr:hypothetical protein [Maritalea mediterranea]MCF4097809.1 hypothetical protein [Maritalea mediterranea]